MSSQGKKKWKWKQTLLGDVLHKGVWRWQHLSEGRDHRTCSWDIRELLKDTTQTKKKSIFSLNLLKKAKSSDIQTWKYFFKNFHSLFDGPTCLNKHYRSIHGATILKGGAVLLPFYDCVEKINKDLIINYFRLLQTIQVGDFKLVNVFSIDNLQKWATDTL